MKKLCAFLSSEAFGRGQENPSSGLLTLRNANGLIAQFADYGARWVSMWVPDCQGHLEDVLLGFDTLAGYCSAGEKYHGAIVGRVCGRINNACFRVGEETYRLASNDVYGKPVLNHLHGGVSGFHNRFWQSRFVVNAAGEESAVFTCFSEDGEEGYPGHLQVKVTYTLTHSNVLRLEYEATADKTTPVNLTNHVFFNLSGNLKCRDILSHSLCINSSQIIECDEELIPTGQLISVSDADGPLDFRCPHAIAASLQSDAFQIQQNKGFSTAFALDKEAKVFLPAAELTDEISGRVLSIYTDQLSLQAYTGYFMDGTDCGKNAVPYYASAGIALETQGFPDAVNNERFPSILIAQGETYRHLTEYRFGVKTIPSLARSHIECS